MDNKKVNYKALVIVIIAATLGLIGGKYLIDYFGKSKNLFDKELIEVVHEMNKHLPIMLDSEMRFDSITALPDKTIQFFYTLINSSKDKLDLEEYKNNMHQVLLNNIKTSSDLEQFRENKVTMIYVFRDKNNIEILKLIYKYDDYKK